MEFFCTVRDFVHAFEMAGRVSEESNEAYNAMLRILKEILKQMPSRKKRIEKITERSQGNLKGDVVESTLAIQNRIKGGKRGPYKPRVQEDDETELLSGVGLIWEVRRESCVVLSSGNLLPEKWHDIYEWYGGGKAPKDWINRLQMTEPDLFNDVNRAVEMNTKLV